MHRRSKVTLSSVGIQVRKAEPEDGEGIARVDLETHLQAYRPLLGEDYGSGATLEATTEYWRKLLSHDPRVERVEFELLVAELDGRISAYSGLGASRDQDAKGAGEVFTLYVHPSAWRSGVGSRLLAEATTRLRELGHPEVTLWVLDVNKRAQAFYEAQGWRPDGATEASRYQPHVNLRYRAPVASKEEPGTSNK
jgi:ribosomal protein S18 acetylase RimI-like enzyme